MNTSVYACQRPFHLLHKETKNRSQLRAELQNFSSRFHHRKHHTTIRTHKRNFYKAKWEWNNIKWNGGKNKVDIFMLFPQTSIASICRTVCGLDYCASQVHKSLSITSSFMMSHCHRDFCLFMASAAKRGFCDFTIFGMHYKAVNVLSTGSQRMRMITLPTISHRWLSAISYSNYYDSNYIRQDQGRLFGPGQWGQCSWGFWLAWIFIVENQGITVQYVYIM